MSIEKARDYLRLWDRESEIIEFDVSSATVELAAKALGTDESRIAKSLAFMKGSQAIIIVTAGNMRIDNKKYKNEFGCKGKMVSPEDVREMIGHEIGGVCPFGIHDHVEVYLDISLQNYDYIYPACGSSNSAIKMNCEELENISRSRKWVDVCKEKPNHG